MRCISLTAMLLFASQWCGAQRLAAQARDRALSGAPPEWLGLLADRFASDTALAPNNGEAARRAVVLARLAKAMSRAGDSARSAAVARRAQATWERTPRTPGAASFDDDEALNQLALTSAERGDFNAAAALARRIRYEATRSMTFVDLTLAAARAGRQANASAWLRYADSVNSYFLPTRTGGRRRAGTKNYQVQQAVITAHAVVTRSRGSIDSLADYVGADVSDAGALGLAEAIPTLMANGAYSEAQRVTERLGDGASGAIAAAILVREEIRYGLPAEGLSVLIRRCDSARQGVERLDRSIGDSVTRRRYVVQRRAIALAQCAMALDAAGKPANAVEFITDADSSNQAMDAAHGRFGGYATHVPASIAYGLMGRPRDAIRLMHWANSYPTRFDATRLADTVVYELSAAGRPERGLAFLDSLSPDIDIRPEAYLHIAAAFARRRQFAEALAIMPKLPDAAYRATVVVEAFAEFARVAGTLTPTERERIAAAFDASARLILDPRA
jgi:hypothetical protein